MSFGHDDALYTLAYFSSAWVQPVDELVLPRLRHVLDDVNKLNRAAQLVGLLEVRRQCEDEEDTCSKSANVQRLEPSTFRSLCKHFQVTDLPACVLLDVNGHALTQGSVKALEKDLRQRQQEDSASAGSTSDSWNVLGGLLKDYGAAVAAWQALRPLWQVDVAAVDTVVPTPMKVDDPVLVKMREEALELFEAGQFLPAASSFVQVLLRCPACTKSSFNLAVILQTIGETYFAVSCMLRVVALDDSDAVAHTVLRSVYYQDEPDLVLAGYHSILPDAESRDSHVRAVHSLATLEGATTTRTAAPAYVAEVFDELAESFEEKLVAHLEYRVPWQLVEALQELSPPGFIPGGSNAAPEWVVADVGCGTGLCGRLLRPHVKHIIGVDISPLMIEKTRTEGSYDELQTADIVPFLESCADESLDLVISADVWIYVGALEQVFALSARKLRASSGWMAFSIELLPPGTSTIEGFRLASSGRFQHSHEYVMSLAGRSGFSVAVQQDISVRKESGEPIPGRIYLLQRVAGQH